METQNNTKENLMAVTTTILYGVTFEINNGVLQKIKVGESGVRNEPVRNVIKIPDGVTEIAENVLDNSVCMGYSYGCCWMHFRGIVIPKSVTKISPNAFKSTKIADSEKISLFFEDDAQKKLADPLSNPSNFNKTIPLLFELSENNPNIDPWLFGKISCLKLSHIDEHTIEFENGIITVSITHSKYVISTLIVDNPWFGRRNIESENASEDTYIFNPKTDQLDEMRIRKLFD